MVESDLGECYIIFIRPILARFWKGFMGRIIELLGTMDVGTANLLRSIWQLGAIQKSSVPSDPPCDHGSLAAFNVPKQRHHGRSIPQTS